MNFESKKRKNNAIKSGEEKKEKKKLTEGLEPSTFCLGGRRATIAPRKLFLEAKICVNIYLLVVFIRFEPLPKGAWQQNPLNLEKVA